MRPFRMTRSYSGVRLAAPVRESGVEARSRMSASDKLAAAVKNFIDPPSENDRVCGVAAW
jgi:hypothetical protein